MELHRTSGRWKLGLALSLCTVLLWGMLPIALKALLRGLDALTISWFRFLLACLLLVAWYARSGELVRLLRAPGRGPSGNRPGSSRRLSLVCVTESRQRNRPGHHGGSGAPLSESQRIRVALARAIAGRPRLLVIDGYVF